VLRWSAKGRIFPPPGAALPDWIGGYGAIPFAVDLGDRRARVFFSGRDAQNRAQIGACTLDLESMQVEIGSVTPQALIAPGPPGAFDESGCSMSSIVCHGSRWLLYYTGWMLGRTVPFYLAAGLAVSDDGGRTFRKHSAAPMLDRTAVDPFLTASPSVLIEDGLWRMWYISGISWESLREGVRHRYLIKYAESDDGIHWRRDGRIAIPFENEQEYAMGRPHVLKDGDTYRMWFCIRGDQYRIACAQSPDGLVWQRVPELPPAAADWDAAMQAYPMVLRDGKRWLMFYNGNGYGATGFGWAQGETSA
jgi:hypothetical protein